VDVHSATSAVTTTLDLLWRDAANTTLLTDSGTSAAIPVNTTVRTHVTGTVPAGATKLLAVFAVKVASGVTPAAGDAVYLDNFMLDLSGELRPFVLDAELLPLKVDTVWVNRTTKALALWDGSAWV
jgi:hypothetical protein